MFDPERFLADSIEFVKKEVRGKAIAAISGGLDSTVAAYIVAQAIGDNLLGVFVNSGLLREGDVERAESVFRRIGIKYKIVDAEKEFLEALRGVVDPEEKRKIIGRKFIEIFEREAVKFGAEYLVQGTIAPDWIESGGGLRDTIKSHHNVGGLPKDMKLKLVEPLRALYKDEVKKIAEYIGLQVNRKQPFPGPGLAIRCIGEVTEEKLKILRRATKIVEEEIERASESLNIPLPWQYFAVLLPVRTVGVHGDVRTYGYTIAVRVVDSVDGMTASYSNIPYEILERISIRITNEIKEVNRVVYDITHKPPATIEWE